MSTLTEQIAGLAAELEQFAVSIERGHCPDCDYRGFTLGPQGGLSINIECGNTDCLARFNVVSYGGSIVFAERIPKLIEGGVVWGVWYE